MEEQIKPTPILEEDVRTELTQMIDEINNAIVRAGGLGKLKSSPVIRLKRAGNLNVNYLMDEYKRVMDKTSKLPSAMRQVVKDLMTQAQQRLAFKMFKAMQDKQQKTDENGTEQKTE